MPEYGVACYVAQGVWDGRDPRTIEAQTMLEAAETVCGVRLAERGKPVQLRAKVWDRNQPAAQCLFYGNQPMTKAPGPRLRRTSG